MVCFRYIIVNTLHRYDDKGYYYYANNNNNNNNNNNKKKKKNNNNKAFTEERTLVESLWQPSSPYLSQRVFFICGNTWRTKFTNQTPHTLDELRKNIRSAVEAIEVKFFCLSCAWTWQHGHKNVLILKVLIYSICCTSVHLVWQKLKETKSFLDFAVQAGGFQVKRSVLTYHRIIYW
jgi:hypothetical protein